MNQQLVFGVLIGVLVIVSAFQALQLSQLNARLQSGAGSGVTSVAYAPAQQEQQSSGQQAQEQVQLPSGIANAPNMVGGC